MMPWSVLDHPSSALFGSAYFVLSLPHHVDENFRDSSNPAASCHLPPQPQPSVSPVSVSGCDCDRSAARVRDSSGQGNGGVSP
jgi:hypothetical protein